MNCLSKFQAIGILMWLLITLLWVEFSSSPEQDVLPEASDDYPIIITAEDTDRDHLD